MKNCLFKFSKLLMLFVVLFSISTVNAETVPGSLVMTSYASGNIPVYFPTTFRVKRTSTGKYAYCSYYAKRPPAAGVLYTNHGQITEKGINYILAQSNNARNDGDFFIYQTALWVYMIEQGMMPQPYYDLTVFRSNLYATNTAAANQIKNLVINARNAAPVDMSAPTIKIDNSKAKFTYDSGSKSYVYGPITVASSTGNYNASLTSAPSGSTIKRNGNQMNIIIPSSKITSMNTKVSFSVNTSKNIYSAYCYEPNNGLYQNMAVPYVETRTASDSKTVNFVKNVSIELDKVDEHGKSLSGAVLQVTDSKGKVIDTWTSNGKKHKISNLSVGTYTLSEKSAPVGYLLTTEKVTFTVDAKGQVLDSNKKVVTLLKLANKRTTVIISKRSVATKGELPGATLVIKDSAGKEVARWVSTDRTHVIRGLAVGTYTLTEIKAPNGYVLSTESIKFSIDNKDVVYQNGKPITGHTIIMYNKPEEKKICKVENGKYYGKNGAEVTEQEYRDQCLKICKVENGKYYGKNGTEVTEQEYRDQCLKICKVENGKYYGKNGTEVTEQEYRDQCLKICKVENGKYYGKNGTEVTEQEYRDQCLKICKVENGKYYGKNGTEVTEQEYRDQCLKICKVENGKYYGKNGTEVTEQEYRDQCLKICKVENGKYYGKNGTEVTEQEYRDQCLKICKVENGKYYGKNGTEVTEQEYRDQCLKICKVENGKYYGKNGTEVTEDEYRDQCLKICKVENGKYYGKNGTEVTEQEYRDQCLKICKVENGKYYGKNGTEVTEDEYRDQCLKICKVENGKYYGKNGTEVTEDEYKDQCLKICKVENGKYYGQNGTEVTEQEYKDQCEKKQVTIISKQDATTGKELPGATLVLKDYDGNVIDTWVSTNETHVIEGLKAGIYTLTETAAPEGYILSTETVTFTVKDDGSITKVVMYNTPDSKEVPPTPVTPTPVPPTPQEVVVENTASFKTLLSSTIGLALTGIGALIIVMSSKKKKFN